MRVRKWWFIAEGDEKRPRRSETTTAYCVKCKTSREMSNPQSITMKNGRHAMKGMCPVCGTSLFRIGG